MNKNDRNFSCSLKNIVDLLHKPKPIFLNKENMRGPSKVEKGQVLPLTYDLRHHTE